MIMDTILLGAMGMMSLLSFCLMGIDKGRAKRGAWRISEKTLLCAAALFGAPGAMAGMYTFRHKTKHIRFRVGLPVMAAIQLAIVFGLK